MNSGEQSSTGAVVPPVSSEEVIQGLRWESGHEAAVPAYTGDDEATFVHAKDVLRNYRALVTRTAEVFGDDIKATLWLSRPSPDFAGKAPIQVAQEVDYAEAELERWFEPIFVRTEEGIYW